MKQYAYGALILGMTLACGEAPSDDDGGSMDAGTGEVFEGPFDLSLDVETVDFGSVQTRTDSEARLVVLRNVGGEAITDLQAMEGADFERGTFSFSLADSSLESGASTELRVVFSPSELGPASSTVLLLASDGTTTRSYGVELEGEGIPAEVLATPAELNFGEVQVGLDGTGSFQVRNDGSSPRTLEFSFSRDVALCEGDVSLFCLVPPSQDFADTAALEVGPGASQSFQVRFIPPSSGSFTGSIGYRCADAGCGGEIGLQGSGIEIGVPGG